MNLRIRLTKTPRSNVLCVACGAFHADHVILLTSGAETNSGIHTKCIGTAAARFTRKPALKKIL